jgi:SAM-dependent methyltransferase
MTEPAEPQTWHHGLIARWWAEFNVGGPEIPYFQRFVERGGGPALDAGCGTGRLLLPFLRAGLDVDGCDVSADMIALCREQAGREGLTPTLYVQALAELDLPRRYRTIVVCGAFGLGSDRSRDAQALRRLYDHLEPGGTLVLDNEVPNANAHQWPYWLHERRRELPEPPEPPQSRRRAADGSEFALGSRIVELDPLAQRVKLEMHAQLWRDGELEADEKHTIDIGLYFTAELQLMLEQAGFRDLVLHRGHEEVPPTPDDDFVVFVARKPPAQ